MFGTTNKPIIFLAFANDRDDTVGYLRNLPDEARRLRDVLEPAEDAGLCKVEVRSNCTAGDIFKVFQDPEFRNRIAIFHYGGHANGYQLLLESAAGENAVADAGGLAAFLAQQQGLQLVFLNGCSTQQQTQGLLDANVPVVLSTSRSIDDQVASDFAHQFYQGLAGGASVRTAYSEAEAMVQTAKGGDTRALYFGDAEDGSGGLAADRWPWDLYLRPGCERADAWNLPEAVNDPLFGLPSLPPQDLPESPYRHLNWFTRKDAEVFFGRGHQIRELYDRLTAARAAPITLFYGQSGVGKSSILDAGLIPRLERDYEVRYLRRDEGGLLDTLQRALLPDADDGLTDVDDGDVPIETAWRKKEEETGKPLIVFLDQVEECFTRPLAELPDELEQLLEAIKATFVQCEQRPRGKLVLGFRKEWLAELESHLIAYELPRTKVFLEPLDRRGIIEVVRGPARDERLQRRYGLTVQEGLAEIIADDLLEDRDSAIAPTLQILLTKMWAKAIDTNYERPHFSQELYQQLRRNGIALRDFLDQQIAAFHESYPEAVDSGLLLDIVARHTTPLGTANQCSIEQLRQQYAHLGGKLPNVLEQCQNLYLLTVTTAAGRESVRTTRLAHDTLAPLVREQFDVSDKPGQRARRILDNRSVDWKDDSEGRPLDAADLDVVERGVHGTRALNATEQRLLDASRELRDRLKLIRRIAQALASAALIAIVVTAGIAVWKWRDAEAETQRALKAEFAEQVAKEEALGQAEIARKQTLVAETNAEQARRNLSTATHSVEVLLELYQELPRSASGVAAATTAEEARDAFATLQQNGLPASLRVTSPAIAQALGEVDRHLKDWEKAKVGAEETDAEETVADDPARKCREAILLLVQRAREAWESRSSSGPQPIGRGAQLAQQNELERNIITVKLCDRATAVTRAMADAPNQEAMQAFRSEFEKLYWAELYWVELEEMKRRPDGASPLESAMVKFRVEGLEDWKLSEISESKRDQLDQLATIVRDRCRDIMAVPRPGG